ncbi:MAG: hypothetical protein ABW156_01305 [Jiangellaceae bacterium]
MHTTPVIDSTREEDAGSAVGRWTSARFAGLGGLAFVGTVIAQNLLRAGYPMNDAPAAQVVEFYADHRGLTYVLAVLYPIGAVGLAAFVAGIVSHAVKRGAALPATVGAFGGAAIMANFTLMLATDGAISGYVHRGTASLEVVEGLWVFHNSVFGVLLASIGIALSGLATAVIKTGELSGRWRPAAYAGSGLLLAAAATSPMIIDGAPTMFLGFAGFLVWVVFVAAGSVNLLRRG